ncbi:MAG: D-inositol 3-phosphate glycosyltransferase [Segetibacter sp.]|nr:D-inositol 3-phosphate glycosyltransferase [Segetibacter sp.]
MRIAVNTRFLANEKWDGYLAFINEVFIRLAKNHPEHEFLFLADNSFDSSISLPKNVEVIVASAPLKNLLTFKWWLDIKLRFVLKKHKVDLLVNTSGFCSLTTAVPQLLIVPDLTFLLQPTFVAKLHQLFFKRYMPLFVGKAKAVVTTSHFIKNNVISHYKLEENKVTNIGIAAKEIFKPIEWQEREELKDKYAEGNEYFLFEGGNEPQKNVMNVLKAFSIFKKWQKTNMKLLVTGDFSSKHDDTLEKLKTYKYRSEVKLTGKLEDEAFSKVLASSYALISPSVYESFSIGLLAAMQSEVPIITSNNSTLEEVAGDAALFVDPLDPNVIAEQMKRMYKDENLRSELIRKGTIRAREFSFEKTVDLLGEAITKAV